MEICRICLNSDRKMYPFNSDRIQLYEQLTGITFVPQDLLPNYICWECGHYMSKYVAFRSKAIRSLSILTEIIKKEGLITQTDCSQYKLKSNLSCTDVLTDMTIEEIVNLLKPSSEIIGEKETIENNINNFTDAYIDLTQDFMDDNNFSDEVLSTDNSISSPLSDSTIEDEDSVEENTKSLEQILCVKSKETEKSNGEKKKSYKKPTNKTALRGRPKRKTVGAAKGEKASTNNKSYLDRIDKNIINITKLTLEEQIAEVQNRKDSDEYKNSPYKCEICFKSWSEDDGFKKHMAKHSDLSGALECPLCKIRYSLRSSFNGHMRVHKYQLSCQQCDFSTKNPGVAIKHQNYHKGKQITCQHCEETFLFHSNYYRHKQTKHPSNVACQYCGRCFLNEKGLLHHTKCAHRFDHMPIPEDGPYCERCDIRFVSQDALETHERFSGKHANERNLTGARRRRKRRREETKSRVKPTSQPFAGGPKPCEQCGEPLASPKEYFIHFRKEHKDKNRTFFEDKDTKHRHICEVCGKVFKSLALLGYHQYAHSETKQFKCEQCGKLFQLEAHLKLHQKHHCGTRVPHPCTVCGKEFSNPSNVQRHMLSHTGIKAYKCELCDKTFENAGNKKNHVDFVHLKKPLPKRNRGARKRTEKHW